MSKKKIPQSLKERFLPILKNKIKFSKECGNKPSDIKKINSFVFYFMEKRKKKKKKIKKNPRNFRSEGSNFV